MCRLRWYGAGDGVVGGVGVVEGMMPLEKKRIWDVVDRVGIGKGNGRFGSFGADNELKFERDLLTCFYEKVRIKIKIKL